jgi:hypothetical protein
VSDFTPGVERAKAAGHKIEVAPYPSGVAGVRLSLDVIARKIRDGRLDPDVRGWARDVIRAAGDPKSVRAQAQAILDAFRKQTTYVPDPPGAEYIASAAATLCLRPGLCVRARDCDDGVVAVGSALLSQAIAVKVIKQNFGPGKQEHVLVVAQDESGGWLAVDPSTNLPVGQRVPAVKEEIIDPMDVVGSAGTSGAEIVTLGKAPEPGARDVHWDGKTWHEHRYGRHFVWTGVGWTELAEKKGAGHGHADGKPCCDECAKKGSSCKGTGASDPDADAPCSACEAYARKHGLMGALGAIVRQPERTFGPIKLPGFGAATSSSDQNMTTLNAARTSLEVGDAYLRSGDYATAIESYKLVGQQLVDLPGYSTSDGQALANFSASVATSDQAAAARALASRVLSGVAAVVDPPAPSFGIGEVAVVGVVLVAIGGAIWAAKKAAEASTPRRRAA